MFNQCGAIIDGIAALISIVMKPTITFLIVFLFSACLFTLQAQDRILKRNGETISCRIREVGSEEIMYNLPEYDSEVRFSIFKSQVDRIVFGNGRELVVDHAEAARSSAEANSADLFLVQNRNAIKIQFLSPLSGVTCLSYERAIKPGQSFEASAGFIGLGFNNPDDAAGLGIRAGYKFIRSPDYYLRGMRYAHILKGGYVRPELVLASYSLREDNRNVTKAGLMLNIGKQWVFSDVFLVDLYVGTGYGFSNASPGVSWPYFFAVGTDQVPIAFNWGFRIGILL